LPSIGLSYSSAFIDYSLCVNIRRNSPYAKVGKEGLLTELKCDKKSHN
jgi:hypothetical protein